MTRVTAPAIRFCSTACCTTPLLRSNRSEDTPTASGFAVGRSCEKDRTLRTRKPSRTGICFRFCPAKSLARMYPPWLRLDGFRRRVPGHRLLSEVRLVRHVACDGRVVPEHRIFRDVLARLHRLEENVQVRTHIVPIVAAVNRVLVLGFFAQGRIMLLMPLFEIGLAQLRWEARSIVTGRGVDAGLIIMLEIELSRIENALRPHESRQLRRFATQVQADVNWNSVIVEQHGVKVRHV